MAIFAQQKVIKKCKELFPEYDYSKLIYLGSRKKFKVICNIHGEFEKSYETFIYRKEGCPKCNGYNKSSKDIIEEFKMINQDYDYSDSKFNGMHNIITIKCNIFGYFDTTPYNFLHTQTCPKCKGYNKTTAIILTELQQIHKNKYTYPDFKFESFKSKIMIHCNIHGNFKSLLQNHYHKKSGCPKCNASKGEEAIRVFLEEQNMQFVSEYKFKDLGLKRFDFYLPETNTCIEYDGKQHFEEIEFFGGKKALNEIQQRDQIKTEYCKLNNIHLIRINYKQFDLIYDILNSELNSLKEK